MFVILVGHSAEGTWVSMGVFSDGSYGAPKDVIYSFPCTCKDGKWTIVQVGRQAASYRVTGPLGSTGTTLQVMLVRFR